MGPSPLRRWSDGDQLSVSISAGKTCYRRRSWRILSTPTPTHLIAPQCKHNPTVSNVFPAQSRDSRGGQRCSRSLLRCMTMRLFRTDYHLSELDPLPRKGLGRGTPGHGPSKDSSGHPRHLKLSDCTPAGALFFYLRAVARAPCGCRVLCSVPCVFVYI